jgi:hypothetical protein
MVTSKPLTEKEKGKRQFLVDKYNNAKTKKSKSKWYAEIMDNEELLYKQKKNG